MLFFPALRKWMPFQSRRSQRGRGPVGRKKAAGTKLSFEPLEDRLAPTVILWDGGPTGTGTVWNDPVDWVGDVLPGPADDAQIDPDFAGITITSSGGVTINSVTSAAPLWITGTFSIAATSSINNNLTLSGTLTGAGTLDIGGLFTWSGGTLSGSGQTNANGGLAITGDGLKQLDGRALNNGGAATWTGAGNIRLDGGASLNNLAGATFDAQNDQFFFGSVGAVTNAGTFRKSAGAGATVVQLPFNNTGSVEVLTGTLSLNAGFTNFSGTTLTGGTYLIAGRLRFNGANIVTNEATIILDGPASAIVNQSDANGLVNFADNPGSFTIQNGRDVTTVGDFNNPGSLTVGSGSTLVVSGNLLDFSDTMLAGGAYVVAGTLQFPGASVATNAAAIVLDGPGSAIVDQFGTDALLNTLADNLGFLSIQNGRNLTTAPGLLTSSGSLAVGSGSTLTVPDGNAYLQTAGSSTLGGGTLTAGLVDIQAGSLGGTGTINGTYNQAAGTNLAMRLNGTAPGAGYDQLLVNGTVNLDGSTLNLSLGYIPAGGTTFTIIDNDDTDAVSGTFTDLPEGAVLSLGGVQFQISYAGGAGNDVVLTALPSSSAQIIDDGDPGFLASAGFFPFAGQGFQGDVTFAAPGDGSEYALWYFSGLEPGVYRVSVTWTPDPNRASNATFYLFDGESFAGAAVIDQQQAPNDLGDQGAFWEDLTGTVTVSSGVLWVYLPNLGNGYLIADAVRIERVG